MVVRVTSVWVFCLRKWLSDSLVKTGLETKTRWITVITPQILLKVKPTDDSAGTEAQSGAADDSMTIRWARLLRQVQVCTWWEWVETRKLGSTRDLWKKSTSWWIFSTWLKKVSNRVLLFTNIPNVQSVEKQTGIVILNHIDCQNCRHTDYQPADTRNIQQMWFDRHITAYLQPIDKLFWSYTGYKGSFSWRQ